MDAKLIVATIGVVFGVSGWATFLYNHITHIPKIKGRIFSPIIGKMVNEGKEITTLLYYLYLTNNRKTAVRAFNYEMKVFFMDGTVENLERVYGSNITDLTFQWLDNTVIDPNLKENLIYKKQQAIDVKEPLHGFVMFAGSEELYKKQEEIESYELTVIDVFNKRHIIKESILDNKVNLYLLSDLADFELPPNTPSM
ncbi:hypothetical protein MUB16_34955 [Priestia sp. OVL9]|nr:hypothetical protein [Priestia sp. OVL9]MCJ7987855.1 hypothetical protein [Priestia sp. OVL9]